jgi:integrase/recombinase XerD
VTALRRAAGDYLAMRRFLGHKLERQGPMLMDFIGYLERAGAATVTVEAALGWAVLPAGAAPVWHKHRLVVAGGFAAYLKTLDPACPVAPKRLLAAPAERVAPYLYSPGRDRGAGPRRRDAGPPAAHSGAAGEVTRTSGGPVPAARPHSV